MAPVVLEPGERQHVRRLAQRGRAHVTHVLVADHRLAGLQHVPHLGLDRLGVHARLDVREAQSEPSCRRAAAELLQGGVRPHEAQVRVHDRDTDRGARHHLLQDRAAHVPAGGVGQLRQEHQPARAAVRLLCRGDPGRDLHRLSVPAARRQKSRPAAVPAAPLDQVRHALGVVGRQQVGQLPADRLGGRVRQQAPRTARPARHHALWIEQQGRRVGHVEPLPGNAVHLVCAHGRPLCR